MKHSLTQIVKLAELFVTRAKCSESDRFWALTVLADDATVKSENVIADTTLAYQIKRLSNTNPSSEEWTNWYRANGDIVGKVAPLYWSGYNGPFSVAEISWDSKSDSSVNAFLSLTSAPPSDRFTPKESFMLKGVGPIPNMFVQTGITDRANSRFIMPPEIAHDNWLFEAFNKLFYVGYTPDEISNFKDFIQKNKSVIRKIRGSFATSAPKYLGGGADGVAYDIGEGKVLKIFRDIASFEKGKAAVERLHNNPNLAKTEAMIYDIGSLGNFRQGGYDNKVYYYIIEKMTPLRELDEELPNYVRTIMGQIVEALVDSKGSKWRALKSKVDDPKHSAEIKKEVEAWAKNITQTLKRTNEYEINEVNKIVPNMSPDWVERYAEEIIMKYLTGRTDLHMGNIGVTGFGQLRYFDPAYGRQESSINF